MVLIIDKAESKAATFSDMFRYMGILAFATTPEHAAIEISNRHKAIIFLRPELMFDAEDIVNIARTYSLDSDVFAISSVAARDRKLYSLFDAVFEPETPPARLISEILGFVAEKRDYAVGTYRVLGIDASITQPKPTYFDTPIALTKTETLILRFLISSYPVPRKADDIIKYVFRQGRRPEASSIRTHISTLNRKFRDTVNKKAVSFINGKGYIVEITEPISEN